MKVELRALAVVAAAGVLSGCDYSGDWLFGQPIEGLPAVYNITGPDGGPIVPATVSNLDEIGEATIYGEVAASQTSELGGVTAEFVGTGGPVCIWVDPESVQWTQAVSENPSAASDKFSYPDNVWDDGDLDLRVGRSVYYTGSPDRIGDFQVTYEDDLGNPVEIALQDCPNEEATSLYNEYVDAGRGSPERCTIRRTDPGVSYTILLRNWATPIDDDRLSFGLLVVNGDCRGSNGLEGAAGRDNGAADENVLNAECVIFNEAIQPYDDLGAQEDVPASETYEPIYGLSALKERNLHYPTYQELEETYCNPGGNLRDFCRPEARKVRENGQACLWDGYEDDESNPLEKVKCFCGDPNDTPENGPS